MITRLKIGSIGNTIACALASASVLSCSSKLVKSELKDTMSIQGSYQCAVKADSPKKETPAEADVSRVRCYQDQWQNLGDEIVFTRTLFQTAHCQTELGRVTFKKSANPNTGETTSTPASCRLIRSNPGWIAEERGRCRLNEIKPNTPTSLKPLVKCSEHLPSFCFSKDSEINFAPAGAAPGPDEFKAADTVTITAANRYSATCKRYLE